MQTINMSVKELSRYQVLGRLLRKEINGPEAAKLMSCSLRHARRLKKKVKAQGAQGLIHQGRGQESNRKMPEKEYQVIVKTIREKYSDFGPTLAAEKLSELHGINRDPETIRQLMLKENLWTLRRASDKHHLWRERKAAEGEMLQFDGCDHDWFENRGGRCTLLAAIDDATGKILQAEFAPHEGVVPVFSFWKEYVQIRGKPLNIYLDQFSTYKMNSEFAEKNHELKTQFQKVCQAIDIKLIFARSPQAKGRVERLFHTLQDRLVKELRLKNISSLEQGNQFLKGEFLRTFNEKFSVVPRSKTNLHRPLLPQELGRLDSLFSQHFTRVVQNDFTVSFNKQWFQITNNQPVTVCKRDTLKIEERLDGGLKMFLRGKELNIIPLPTRPLRVSSRRWIIPARPALALAAQAQFNENNFNLKVVK